MDSVFDTLHSIDPSIESHAAGDFSSTLAAIFRKLTSDSGAEKLSLQQWWQWIDEAGYDRDGFIKMLQQFCRARIGDDGVEELTASCISIKEQPDGIPQLLDQLETDHEELSNVLQELHVACLSDQLGLETTAGGMTKGGKIALGSFGAAGAIGLVGYGIYKFRRRGRTVKEAGERLEISAEDRTKEFEAQITDKVKYDWKDKADRKRFFKEYNEIYKNCKRLFDFDKFANDKATELQTIKDATSDLVDRRIDKKITSVEEELMKKMGINDWILSNAWHAKDKDLIKLAEDPEFMHHVVKYVKLDILYQIYWKTDIEQYLNDVPDEFKTDAARELLQGKISTAEKDIVIDVKDVAISDEELLVNKSEEIARDAIDSALEDAEMVRVELDDAVDKQVESAVVDTDEILKKAERKAIDASAILE
jgi:hypothetical protein